VAADALVRDRGHDPLATRGEERIVRAQLLRRRLGERLEDRARRAVVASGAAGAAVEVPRGGRDLRLGNHVAAVDGGEGFVRALAIGPGPVGHDSPRSERGAAAGAPPAATHARSFLTAWK